jgi:hypothetical protein
VSDQVTVEFKTSRGFTASGGECGEGRDQTVPLAFRHVAYDTGDFVATVRGDRVHDLLPAPGQLDDQFATQGRVRRRSIKPAVISRSTMRPVVERCT